MASFRASPNPVALWIDGKPVTSTITFPVVNAGTNEVVHQAYGATRKLALEAVESAQNAFTHWRRVDPWARRRLLTNARNLLEEQRQEVAEMIRLETPAPDVLVEAINIDGSLTLLEELAAQVVPATTGWVPNVRDPKSLALVLKEPQGVQLGVAPWNASLYLGLRAVVVPIACGNTAVLKASELSPKIHQYIGKLLSEAGFPPGVLNVVQHRREDAQEVLEALISHRAVAKVNFTGSTAVGKILAELASRYCKPTLMELGGKAPQIVLADADLSAAAEAAAMGAFIHHGQSCMSTETLIAHESIADELVRRIQMAIDKVYQPSAGVTEQAAIKVQVQISKALEQGARLANGNVAPKRTGALLEPSIVLDLKPDSSYLQHETFGPALGVVKFKTESEAILLANGHDYGLSSSIFTKNIPKALAMARSIKTGAVHINSMTLHDEPTLPHGGAKASGWGRFGVPWGFDEFCHLKNVTIASDELARWY